MELEVIESVPCLAADLMRRDSELLLNLESQPILHFYDWLKPCATYGYFLQPEKCLNLVEVEKRGIELARRPTGGGLVFHTVDLAFALLIPATHPLYATDTLTMYAHVNRTVLKAISRFLAGLDNLELYQPVVCAESCRGPDFCMAKATQYDVLWQGKKVGGAAQRRSRRGVLHQGTIALSLPEEEWLEPLLWPGSPVLAAIREASFSLLPSTSKAEYAAAKKELRGFLSQEIKQQFA